MLLRRCSGDDGRGVCDPLMDVHVANGGLSAAVSLVSIGGFDKTYDLSDAPLIAIGAGIAAGFAYWELPAGARILEAGVQAQSRAAAAVTPA